MPQIKVKKLNHFDPSFPLPQYETKGAAGADIRACFENAQDFTIKAGARVLIPTGLAMQIEEGFEIQVRPRSGLSLKTHLLVVNSPGTIDSDYRGEIKIILGNLGSEDHVIKHGDRVAQLVLAPVLQGEFSLVENLDTTARQGGGFGSTGA